MINKLIKLYKIQLLISITVSITIIALTVSTDPIEIGAILFGSLLGTFVLDLDYFIYAYFLEPTKDFSKNIMAFIKHGDVKNILMYIDIHKNDIEDKTLHSTLFQTVFAVFSIFVISSNTPYLVKSIVISILANSIYRFLEAYFKGNVTTWFWAFKNTPSKNGMIIYIAVIFSILSYCLYLL